VHLPGSRAETPYARPVNIRLLREATVALLEHPEWTPSEFTAWVDANRSRSRPDFIAHIYLDY
jgi:hypothetical protein